MTDKSYPPPCRYYLRPLYLSVTLYACAQREYIQLYVYVFNSSTCNIAYIDERLQFAITSDFKIHDVDLSTNCIRLKLYNGVLWVRLANRGRLLLRTPGPVPFGTCICSNVETILSWTCHVYGLFEFRSSLDPSILPFRIQRICWVSWSDLRTKGRQKICMTL